MKTEYEKGMLKIIDKTIDFCNKEINKIKSTKMAGSSTRQITNGGKVLSYTKVIQKMNVQKKLILKRTSINTK